ncbi:hypothetical protein [Moritella sp. 28]|uniref:hypothetical protein n=1 Tax=Moritella sp. 28 TaxID=2746232 RepID=UPI001BA841F4|nr:hypothetical protein [Moritella sp. 28]QUM85493.1 hypothetical protein HWV02_13750 [Moritella sp. 28]
MSKINHFASISLFFAASSICYASNIEQTDPVSDYIQSSTSYFQKECHLYGTEVNIPSNCSYYALSLNDLSANSRKLFTARVFGLGVDSKFVLITNPNEPNNREIFLLDEPDLDYLSLNLIKGLDKRSSSIVSDYESSDRQIMKYIVHQPFKVEKKGNGLVDFKYTISLFSKAPYYAKSGDKDKYVEIALSEGAGVDIGLADKWSNLNYYWNDGSTTNFVYEEYVDGVDVDVIVDDKEKITTGLVYLNDLSPRMGYQTDRQIDKETSTGFKVGFPTSAKLPIKDVEFTNISKYTVTNRKEFRLNTKTNKNGYNVKYVNNKYGSLEKNFCNLGTADGHCWDYADKREGPWDLSRVKKHNSLAVAGLRPDFVAKIAAKDGVDGSSDIRVKTTVDSIALFGHNRMIIGRLYAAGSGLWTSGDCSSCVKGSDLERLLYVNEFTFTVDWDSPVFLGASAVTIKSTYLSQEVAQCLTAMDDRTLEFKECIDGSKSQSFVYDQEKRYRSVANIDQCLDSADDRLRLSSDCDNDFAPNTQVWIWQEPNIFTSDVIFTLNNDLTINAIDSSTKKASIFTMDHQSEIPPAEVGYTSRFTDFSNVKE